MLVNMAAGDVATVESATSETGTTQVAPEWSGWRPSHNPWAVALTVTLATFMEVLDSSIANVALRHIAGGFSAGQDESTWVLTSYLVSNAVVLPISAWLATRFGRKRFYMTCVAVFTASSFLCGLAPSLGMLIFFRILQGAGGGGLAPSEQAILADTFPPSKRGIAFAVYGMAVVVAPAIGPTLGGWITDNYTWRWIFYINVPVGLLSLFLTQRMVEDPPYLAVERKRSFGARVDYMGLGLVALGMSCLQIVLDKGEESDWFGSPWITFFFALTAVALVSWVIWEWRHPDPIVDVRLFKHRNFATAMFFTFILGVVLYGTTVLIPQFLQSLLGYPAVRAGEALAGGGVMMLIMMPISGMLVSRVDPRGMMSFGFAVTSAALVYMTTHMTLGMDFTTAALLRTFQAAGLPFIFIPSNTLAYVGIAQEKNNQVSSMNTFIRNVGGSIGIALITTFVSRQTQKHQTFLSSHTSSSNHQFQAALGGLTQTLVQKGFDPVTASNHAWAQMQAMIQAHSANLAYVDVVSIMALVVACLVPLPFFMKRGLPGTGAPMGH
jgi:MFS transporter, DHA2 family, multidrug resistance protein